jgi:iron(III) transport system substrate-binding protein
MIQKRFLLPAFAALAIGACSQSSDTPAEVGTTAEKPTETLTIYSSRHYDSDRLMFDAFVKSAGVKVDVRESKADQLLETMKAEGDASPADIILAADAGSLWKFQNAGLTQPITNTAISSQIPSNYQQADGHWFGVARRVRGVVFDPTRWQAEDVDAWSDLTDTNKNGEICVRSSSNIYNLSLMGELIARTGSDAAGEWAKAVAENMARKPQGGDTDQIRGIAAGECSTAIVNHYYWVRLSQSASVSDQEAAGGVQFIVPSFGDGNGAHANITGAGVTVTADNPELAADFIAYLLTDEGQKYLTMETKELPITASAELPEGVEIMPTFTASETPLETFGENQAEAQRLFDLANWN